MRTIWVMGNHIPRQITAKEIEVLPQQVFDTLDLGCLAISSHTGQTLLYGNQARWFNCILAVRYVLRFG